MRVLVVTVVHHPEDARILGREIASLVKAGHGVTYAAPWKDTGSPRPTGLRSLDLPRAAGRRRLGALLAARRLIRRESPRQDLILIHDPELLIISRAAGKTPLVWDVHEDLSASLVDKPWLPKPLRMVLGRAVRLLERWAEGRMHLILAERAYQARFRRRHPVVANEPEVPEEVSPPGDRRVVYVGRLSVGRGALDLIKLAELLGDAAEVHLFGWCEPDCEPVLERANAAGDLVWHGRTPNEVALRSIEGALAGLSLLHDLPNYRHSRPTKVVEYMSRGLPVITTPSPVAVELVKEHQCGLVVPFEDVTAVADAVLNLTADRLLRERLADNGHRAAREHYDWGRTGPRFASLMEGWGQTRRT